MTSPTRHTFTVTITGRVMEVDGLYYPVVDEFIGAPAKEVSWHDGTRFSDGYSTPQEAAEVVQELVGERGTMVQETLDLLHASLSAKFRNE